MRDALGACLPVGWRLVDAYDVWLGEAALPGRVVASVYRAVLESGSTDTPRLTDAARLLLAAHTLPRERRKGDNVIAYDLRPFVEDVEVIESDGATAVRMTLRHDPEKGVGRPEELLAALGEAMGASLRPVSLVRERLVLGDPPAPSCRPLAGAPPREGDASSARGPDPGARVACLTRDRIRSDPSTREPPGETGVGGLTAAWKALARSDVGSQEPTARGR